MRNRVLCFFHPFRPFFSFFQRVLSLLYSSFLSFLGYSIFLSFLSYLVAKSRGTNLRVHYKNAVEVACAIRGMDLTRAKAYLNNVLQQKEAIPYTHFTGGRGRHAQAKSMKTPGSLAGWPKNSVKAILNLLENAEANATTKSLDTSNLIVNHSQVNMAPKGRRRTYRAHGRINPYMRVPAHIEIILTAAPSQVAKSDTKPVITQFKRKLASRGVIKTGGGQ